MTSLLNYETLRKLNFVNFFHAKLKINPILETIFLRFIRPTSNCMLHLKILWKWNLLLQERTIKKVNWSFFACTEWQVVVNIISDCVNRRSYLRMESNWWVAPLMTTTTRSTEVSAWQENSRSVTARPVVKPWTSTSEISR